MAIEHRSGAGPPDTVIDGEIVIADADGSSDFGALQQRLGVGRRDAARSAQQMPAVLLAFDVLRCEGADLTPQPFQDRRAILESLLAPNPACLPLIVQTAAVEQAEDWAQAGAEHRGYRGEALGWAVLARSA